MERKKEAQDWFAPINDSIMNIIKWWKSNQRTVNIRMNIFTLQFQCSTKLRCEIKIFNQLSNTLQVIQSEAAIRCTTDSLMSEPFSNLSLGYPSFLFPETKILVNSKNININARWD